jgi:hypothetical protein
MDNFIAKNRKIELVLYLFGKTCFMFAYMKLVKRNARGSEVPHSQDASVGDLWMSTSVADNCGTPNSTISWAGRIIYGY